MEFAAALVANRMKVIVVFPGKHLMANLFTPKIAEFYENYYASKGVTFIKGTAVSSLQISSEKVTAAILRDGRRLPADMPRSTAPRSSSTGRPSSSSPTLTTPTSTVPRNRSSVPSGSRRTPIETHAKQCHFRLASCAAGGGLRTAAECVKIAIGYSDLLEARGLSLSSVLMKQFRPSVEQALDSNLRRIEESTAALAAADDWILTYPPTGIRPLARSSGNLALQPKLSSSAHRFNSMVQDFFEDVGPLVSLQLGGSAMDGLLKIFNSYVNDILDIGCSVGVSTRYLTEKFPSAQAAGLDLSPYFLVVAAQKEEKLSRPKPIR
ncbi:Exocyst complex component EXO84B [Zea mays]|uniref:Exocyst complex component EXO84B n=1 Tax=Zea mays TaxID=4577 RepID=A0A317Y8G0_MAIZE|nr:Exocyst complex component EXO84B [Zea mays]